MTNSGAKPQVPDKLSQDEILKILEEREKSTHHELASRTDAGPDVLLYLATKGAAVIRRAVAANMATPAQANHILADDEDDEVRSELARKIGRLMPDLDKEQNEKLRALTIETLEKLADDQLPRVRAILAEEIKALDCVPKKVIRKLAFDLEMIVAAPILEYSPLLSDADLMEVIATAKASEALTAISKRKYLSANVADAIVTSLDVPAVAALLANPDAEVRAKALDDIIERAEKIRAWHQPLVMRADLSQRAIKRIATFVGAALIEMLGRNHKLDPDTRDHLNQQLRRRIESGEDVQRSEEDRAAVEVEAARRKGKLDDAFVDAAAEAGRREVVAHSLAALAHVPVETVRKILQFRSAKPVTALVWRAKLSMRVAFRIQRYVMKLPTSELLPARDGVRFPLSEDEMRWHLSYFDVGTL
ncbi:MAG TPA: DUF2336 domain-containing protein [Rhizomicrobium sp.]|nr:DUF2336 domain-containing protein [Rhizomicrobium sp.]